MNTSGAARISARSASGPLPPSLVNSTCWPKARCIARRPASTAGEVIGEWQGRTPGWTVTVAVRPSGVWAATYSRNASPTSAGSWSATRRKEILACAALGMMVLEPGPV